MSDKEVDLKLYMKVVQEQFKALNAKFDDLQSTSKSKVPLIEIMIRKKKRSIIMKSLEGEEKVNQEKDDHLGNIQMTIPLFQSKNYP